MWILLHFISYTSSLPSLPPWQFASLLPQPSDLISTVSGEGKTIKKKGDIKMLIPIHGNTILRHNALEFESFY
jgi:hypothetical protein